MFSRLFGGGKPAAPVEDTVWATREARDRRWTGAGDTRAARVYVVRSLVDLDPALAALAASRPERIADGHEAMGFERALARPEAVVVALADRLRARAAAGGLKPSRFEAHVRSRSPLRADDAAISAALAALGATRIVFHSALDEAPLSEHAAAVRPLLERLGLGPDESMTSPLLARNIAKLQR